MNYLGEVREGAERVGFEVVTVDGRKGPLASTNISRYFCDIHVMRVLPFAISLFSVSHLSLITYCFKWLISDIDAFSSGRLHWLVHLK